MKKLLRRLEPRSLGAAVAAWFRDRLDTGPLLSLLDKKTVPAHRHSWIYLLGGAASFLFAMQVASGSLLMLYYQPTEAAAHESVRKIATEVPFGWLVRSVHAWARTSSSPSWPCTSWSSCSLGRIGGPAS